jgi:hypothetical protein
VSAAASIDHVRFTALALAREIQVQILSSTGELVYDSRRQPGNRFEWTVKGQDGSGLLDGDYGALVTVTDLYGRSSHSWATIRMKGGGVRFQHAGNGEAAAAASDELDTLMIMKSDESFPFTLLSHDGKEGWIESASGGLSFYAGSLSPNRDAVPQLRLTPEGNLGIGVREPQAKLDVAGVIRASEGIQFSDGTILKMQGGFPVLVSDRSVTGEVGLAGKTGSTNTAGKTTRFLSTSGSGTPVFATSGTAGAIAKFTTDTDLGDSIITESSGRIGIGTATPDKSLQIVGTQQNPQPALHIGGSGDETKDVFSGMGPNVDSGPGFNFGYSGSSFGRSSGFFNVRPDPSAVAPNPSLRFMTANTQRMIITNLGRVGIATTNPTEVLEVAGSVKVSGTGNGIVFPDGSALTSSLAARIRSITYLAGCDTCGVLADADDQRTIFVNLTGPMTINSVICFSDAGTPLINIQRDSGTQANILSGDLTCSTAGATSTGIVGAQSVLNLNDKLDFVMVSAGGVAKRVTVAVKATVN